MIKLQSQRFLFLLIILGSFTFTSCKKAVELEPVGNATIAPPIHNDADVAANLNLGYQSLADDNYYGGSLQIFSELLADRLDGSQLGGNYLGIYTRNTNIFNFDNSTFYALIHKVIFQSNLTLDFLSVANASNKARYEGEAKFLRALAYFDLVRMYAHPYTVADAATLPGIPLRLNSARQEVKRSTVAESYAQIIKDLKDAETLLPASNSVYATKWAAKAILAKVYFQMNDFVNAYAYANDVIANGGFGFDTNYRRRFSAAGTPETVFGLTFEANNPQGRFGRLRSYNTIPAATPTLRLTNAFYVTATSNPSDIRRGWYTTKNGFFLLNKFDSASFKLPIIHITELKLIRAESAAETGTNLNVAIADINNIVARAYGTTSSLILPASASAALIREAARRERDLELVGEGNRLHELKRRAAKGEQVTIRGSVYNCPGLIFPFPSNEIIHSPLLTQNPSGGCN